MLFPGNEKVAQDPAQVSIEQVYLGQENLNQVDQEGIEVHHCQEQVNEHVDLGQERVEQVAQGQERVSIKILKVPN